MPTYASPSFGVTPRTPGFVLLKLNFAFATSLMTALPQDAFRVVAHLVEDDPPADAYVQLKAALIASHVLSNYQRVEMLAKMEPLSGRLPSEMLTAMLELCPHGKESSTFFFFFFLQQLPREIHVLLVDENPADLHAVADKADKLVANLGALVRTPAAPAVLYRQIYGGHQAYSWPVQHSGGHPVQASCSPSGHLITHHQPGRRRLTRGGIAGRSSSIATSGPTGASSCPGFMP
jgi:hypothetical protein